jgi:hypothetical protein
MEWNTKSESDLRRIEVLSSFFDCTMMLISAAHIWRWANIRCADCQGAATQLGQALRELNIEIM